jgi:hypothetical protein
VEGDRAVDFALWHHKLHHRGAAAALPRHAPLCCKRPPLVDALDTQLVGSPKSKSESSDAESNHFVVGFNLFLI